nr:5'/3'-nucleotidase SurE [Bacteroidales bacterium]
GAVLEGCINGIPSIGFSLLDFSKEADFSTAVHYAKLIISRVLEEGLPSGTCLNVNVPRNNGEPIKGMKICRQNRGLWREEFDRRVDPQNQEYFWLTGEFHNLEPEATDTDEWALAHRYVSVVPVKIDLTDYQHLGRIKHWENHIP